MKYLNFIILLLIGSLLCLIIAIFLIPPKEIIVDYSAPTSAPAFWQIRSVDTMKYSRDLSREKMNDPEFDEVIDKQIRDIAAIGATHAAIATPYDEEFIPMLARWVSATRKYKLKVWFRGNLSGWEKWFEYEGITREEHTEMIGDFIADNPDLFQDGDIFSSCPECENGGHGDPRKTGDAEEYRKFIIQEYRTAKSAFQKIGKLVDANYFSMNGDVAKLIMDKKTTVALDGIVTIDHYVETPEKLLKDIENLAAQSGGKIVLGEFGAPIPDIHGEMTPEEQAQWISKSLFLLARSRNVIGINYWVSVGGSTAIWDSKGNQLPGADIIREFYKPDIVYGVIADSLDFPVPGAEVSGLLKTVYTDNYGYFEIPVVKKAEIILNVSASGYKTKNNIEYKINQPMNIALIKEKESILYKFRSLFLNK